MTLPQDITEALALIRSALPHLTAAEGRLLVAECDRLAATVLMRHPAPAGIGRQAPDLQAERARLGTPVELQGAP